MAQEAGGISDRATLPPTREQVAGSVTAALTAKSVLHPSPLTCAAFVDHACHVSVISNNPPELGVEQFAMIAGPIGHSGSAAQPLCLCGVCRMKFVMSQDGVSQFW